MLLERLRVDASTYDIGLRTGSSKPSCGRVELQARERERACGRVEGFVHRHIVLLAAAERTNRRSGVSLSYRSAAS